MALNESDLILIGITLLFVIVTIVVIVCMSKRKMCRSKSMRACPSMCPTTTLPPPIQQPVMEEDDNIDIELPEKLSNIDSTKFNSMKEKFPFKYFKADIPWSAFYNYVIPFVHYRISLSSPLVREAGHFMIAEMVGKYFEDGSVSRDDLNFIMEKAYYRFGHRF